MPGTGVIQATYNGGVPPYAVSMKFTEANQPTTELFDNNKRQGASTRRRPRTSTARWW